MEKGEPLQSAKPEESFRHAGRRHRGGVSGIGAGVFLPLLGILLFLANQGIVAGDRWWQFLIIGAGVILLVENLVRYRKDGTREIRIGRLIAAIILIGIGTAFLAGNSTWWPLIIILVAGAVIIGGLMRRGRNKAE